MKKENKEILQKLSDLNVKSDFHIHSAYSGDGVYTVESLFKQVQACGLKAISIADHDCVEATEEAQRRAQNLQINYISGVEITTFYQNQFIHILGYNYDMDPNNKLNVLLRKIKERRIENIKPTIKKIEKMGLFIDESVLKDRLGDKAPMVSTYGKVILDDPRNQDNPILKPYLKGGKKEINGSLNFAKEYMLYGQPLYVKELDVTMSEGVSAIINSGGVAVMAHPGLWVKPEHKTVLQKLKDEGLSGMEVYTPYHTAEQTIFYENLANDLGLVKTHGSDYHGISIKPKNKLGCFTICD